MKQQSYGFKVINKIIKRALCVNAQVTCEKQPKWHKNLWLRSKVYLSIKALEFRNIKMMKS